MARDDDPPVVDPAVGEFGRRVQRLRQDLGWTQRDLAQESGVGERTIAYLERGRSGPTLTTLLRLARALGVAPETLVAGLEEQQP